MSTEVVARVLSIELDEENDVYVVEFWVGQELSDKPTLNEAFAMLSRLDSLQREVFSFTVQWDGEEVTMEPDEELSECLALFDQFESPADLGSAAARQWKTGQMAEALVTQLVNANVFGVWRTYDPAEEEQEAAAEEEALRATVATPGETNADADPATEAAATADDSDDDASGNGLEGSA